MARSSKSESAKKTKKTLGKTLWSIILIVLLLIGDFVYSKIPQSDENSDTNGLSIIETLLGYFVTDENVSTDIEEPTNTDANDQVGHYTSDKLEVYFFDVGQADAILLLTGDKAMLVDTGNAGDAQEKDKLVEGNINLTHELRRLGIEEIDILVLTHPHEDHMGSAYKIINAFEIDTLYVNALLDESERPNYYKRFVTAIENSSLHMISPTTLSTEEIKERVTEYNATLSEDEEKLVYDETEYIRLGDTIPFGNARITMIAPASAEYSDTNDYSIVLMVEFEDVKLLLTGDAGKESEEEILQFASENNFDLDCDILKVGHHGSRTANTEAFISAVKPEYAIVMVAEGNSYGLPDEDVLERLENHGAVIYKTMDKGDIKLIIDDGEYEFDFTYSHEEKPEE